MSRALTGKPLVVHVAERAARARRIDGVRVATDDRRIVRACADHGIPAVMTRPDHPNGTTRIAEVAGALDEDVAWIVNVQGDEPCIEPGVIDRLVACLAGADAPMATVGSPFDADEDPDDPNIVKVVVDRRGRALYFSRARIPVDRDGSGAAVPLKHVGLYGYRRDFLATYVSLEPTPAETSERLEQLRVLEHGYPIAVVEANVAHHGIDTPEQYTAFVRRYRALQADP